LLKPIVATVRHVVSLDPLRLVLFRHHLAVQERLSDHVGEAVVGLLFRPDTGLVPLLATSDDVAATYPPHPGGGGRAFGW
jgi:hypothetical protein